MHSHTSTHGIILSNLNARGEDKKKFGAGDRKTFTRETSESNGGKEQRLETVWFDSDNVHSTLVGDCLS